MITMSDLSDILLQVFYDGDKSKQKYIVPLQGDWFVPTLDPSEPSADWIGFLKIQTQPLIKAYQQAQYKVIDCVSDIRLTFIGPNAEERAYTTLLWNERSDIIELLKKYNATLRYDVKRIYSQPCKQSGESNILVWVFDCKIQEYLAIDTHQKPW